MQAIGDGLLGEWCNVQVFRIKSGSETRKVKLAEALDRQAGSQPGRAGHEIIKQRTEASAQKHEPRSGACSVRCPQSAHSLARADSECEPARFSSSGSQHLIGPPLEGARPGSHAAPPSRRPAGWVSPGSEPPRKVQRVIHGAPEELSDLETPLDDSCATLELGPARYFPRSTPATPPPLHASFHRLGPASLHLLPIGSPSREAPSAALYA